MGISRSDFFLLVFCLLFGCSMSFDFMFRCFPNFKRCLDVPIIDNIDRECQCSIHGLKRDEQGGDACADFFLQSLRNSNLISGNATLMDLITVKNNSIDIDLFMLYLTEFSSCTTINTAASSLNTTMVHTCPQYHSNKTLVNLCEETDLALGLPPIENIGDVPIVFRNMYCALCHGISREYLVSSGIHWTPKIVCNEGLIPKDWSTIQLHLKLGKCVVYYKPPKLPCRWYFGPDIPDLIKTECQECVNTRVQSLSCLKCIFGRKLLTSDCWAKPGQDEEGDTTGVATLFLVPSDTEILISINGGLFKANKLCTHDEHFDVLLHMCRRFVCPSEQVPWKGQCIENGTVYLAPESQPLGNGTHQLYITIIFNSDFRRNYTDVFTYKIQHKFVDTPSIEVVENITLKGEKPLGIQFSLNRNIATIGEVLRFVGDLPIPDELRVLTFITHIQNYYQVPPRDVQCIEGAYLCRNGSALELIYEEASIFVEVTFQNNKLRLPLSNILFQISMSSNHSDISVDNFCYCEPKLRLTTNCSFTSYQYQPNEYRIDTDGRLQLLNQDVKYKRSEYEIQNYTAFICYNPYVFTEFFKFDAIQTYVSWVCSGLSIAALFVTLGMYTFLGELRNLPGKLTMGLSFLLICGQSLLLIPYIGKTICTYLAALTHFTWLSIFMWMGAISINMLLTFHPKTMYGSSRRNDSTFKRYAILCFLVSGVFCGTLLILDLVPGKHLHVQYGVVTCTWMANYYGYIGMFFIPIGLILILNIICFSLTLYYIEHTMTTSDKVTGRKRDRDTCVIYIKLSSVMGFTWIFGYVAHFTGNPILWYVYIIFNGLQGVFIFLSFSLNSRSRQMAVDKLSRLSKYKTSTDSSQKGCTQCPHFSLFSTNHTIGSTR